MLKGYKKAKKEKEKAEQFIEDKKQEILNKLEKEKEMTDSTLVEDALDELREVESTDTFVDDYDYYDHIDGLIDKAYWTYYYD